jgi:glucose/arabinose dehydrogenase
MKMIVLPGKGKPFFVCTLLTVFAALALIIYSCDKNDHNNNNNRAIDMEMVADGFVSPIGTVSPPDNTKRLFVIDQIGKVWIVDKSGSKISTPFIDLSSRIVTLNPNYDERGLLGLAFHPDYKQNGKFYVYYQLPPRPGGPQSGVAWNNLSRISEFKVSSNSNQADLGSEKILLEMDDPQSNHNGGTLAFGPDGYLYIAIGDGGAANDVAPGHVEDWYAANAGGNGQDVAANLFGNVLRINVNSGSPYAIPADNPFVGREGKPEIYAYGFRNPFRFSFDMGGSHQLILGDAGQVLYEEIDVVTKGGNYGWNVKEGRHCFNAANNDTVLNSCPTVDNFGNTLTDPVIEVNNAANPAGGKALTIIGGNVYRGNDIQSLKGKYIFGSYAQSNAPNGELFMAEPSGSDWAYSEISLKSHPDDLGYYLKGFGQDNDGEIYLTVSTIGGPSGTAGKVMKLVKAK